MSAETLINAALLADSTTTALVAARIYPLLASQACAVPFVVFTRISTVPTNTTTGESATHQARFQFDCYDDNLTDANTLADAVQSAVLAASTLRAMRLDRRSYYESDAELFRVLIDFHVWTSA